VAVTRTIIFRFTRTVVKYADVQRRNRPDIQTELIIIRALVRATGERVKHVRPNVIIFRPDRTNDGNETKHYGANIIYRFRFVAFCFRVSQLREIRRKPGGPSVRANCSRRTGTRAYDWIVRNSFLSTPRGQTRGKPTVAVYRFIRVFVAGNSVALLYVHTRAGWCDYVIFARVVREYKREIRENDSSNE